MLDDAPPPTKRLKIQRKPFSGCWNKENQNPDYIPMARKEDYRKRKVPVRKPTEPNLLHLNAYVLLDVLDYLSLEGMQFLIRMILLTKR